MSDDVARCFLKKIYCWGDALLTHFENLSKSIKHVRWYNASEPVLLTPVLYLCFGAPCRRTRVPVRCRDAWERGPGPRASAQSNAVHLPRVQTGRPAHHPHGPRDSHPPSALHEP